MSDPSDHFVDLDGPVHYCEWAGPADSPVVCLHAVGGSALHWRGVAPALARQGRVLALDQIGFGLTPRAGRRAGVDAGQQLLSRFLRATDARPAVLVGHSMGAAVALLQAVREPSSVRALVLSSPLLPPSRDGSSDRAAVARYVGGRARMRVRAARRAFAHRPTLERIVSESLRRGAADPDRIDPALIRDSIVLARRAGFRETARAFTQGARSTFAVIVRGRQLRDVLDRAECPVLLLHGDRDRTIPLAFAERAAHDHPGWQLRVFPGLGHLLQLEDAALWLAAVEPWLASLPLPKAR